MSVKKDVTAAAWLSFQAPASHSSLSSLASGQISLIFDLIQLASALYCPLPFTPSMEPIVFRVVCVFLR